ncbi:MAG: DUF2164 family protein [Candidatus Marinimicrobia bacterium]|nr:DUF2164 family protein [Candidatus Neomarinimicrobiota bacterium]
MDIKFSGKQKTELRYKLKQYFEEHFDQEIGELKTTLLLDFLIGELGPAIYNQAIKDTSGFIQQKLIDLEDEHYIPETPE